MDIQIVILMQAMVQGVMLGLVYGLMGLGITMVFSITRLLNFAHGDFMALAMYLCLALYHSIRLDPYLSALITTPLLFLFGAFIFQVLFRRVLRAHILMVIQLTLGMVFVIENSLLLGFGADYESIPTFLTAGKIHLGPLVIRAPHLVAFFMGGSIAIGLFWALQNTHLGRSIRAIAQNPDAAKLMGINVGRIQMLVFAGAIGLLGLSGPLVIPIMTMTPFMGLHLTLFSFIVFVMGGIGNFLGTILAGVILGVAESMGLLYLGGNLALVVPYGCFVLVLLLRPQGLLGER
jgi:branched-chain amino acid transport system permease protein